MTRGIVWLGAAALLLAAPALAGNPPAIEWIASFGSHDTTGRCAYPTNDGGYVVTGHILVDFADTDVVLAKFNSQGNREWVMSLGGTNHDRGHSVRQTSDDGYVVAGTGLDSLRYIVMRTDSLGAIQWTDTGPARSSAMDILQTADGSYLVAGDWALDNHVHLTKLDFTGDVLWDKSLPLNSTGPWSRFVSIAQTQDGGYIAAMDGLVKTDSLGDVLWARTYNGVSALHSVQATADGGFVATGVGPNPSYPWQTLSIALLKVNAAGEQTWIKRFRRNGYPSQGHCVRQLPDGGYFLTASAGDGYLIRTNAQGNTVWTKLLAHPDTRGTMWGERTADGGFVVMANHSLVKLAPEGQ